MLVSEEWSQFLARLINKAKPNIIEQKEIVCKGVVRNEFNTGNSHLVGDVSC